jgi:CheY-like chemotaxis protein
LGKKWVKRGRIWWGVPSLRVVPGVSGRVLVVDDNKVIRQLIRVNLELEGFEVVTAADGAECLDVVRRARPDVVTLDVVMPRLDGIAAAARLRADPWTRDVRIVVVSACSQAEVERGVVIGVDAFLGKPFEPGELVSVVRGLARASARVRGDAEGGPNRTGAAAGRDGGELGRVAGAPAERGGADFSRLSPSLGAGAGDAIPGGGAS